MLRYDDDDDDDDDYDDDDGDDDDNDGIDAFLGNLLQGENDTNSFSDNDSENYHCTKNELFHQGFLQ